MTTKYLAAVNSGSVLGASDDAAVWAPTGSISGLSFGLHIRYYPSHHKWLLCGTSGLFKQSSDGGATFSDVTGHNFGSSNVRATTRFKGLFIAGGQGANKIQTSTDLITWTNRSSPFGTSGGVVYEFAASADVLVVIGKDDSNNTQIAITTDGINYTSQYTDSGSNIATGVCYSASIPGFTAVGAETGPGALVLTSPTGTVWTKQTPPGSTAMNAASFGNGYIIGVCVGGHIFRTANPASGWVEQTHDLTGELFAANFLPDGFVVGNATGRVAKSNALGDTWAASVDAGVSGAFIRSLGVLTPQANQGDLFFCL